MSFGILTLSTPNDYLKAIGLSLSLKISNPGVPTAVACSSKIKDLLAPYYDFVIDENPELRGFVHKIYLDRYSPFETTLFFDSDILVFKPVKPYIEAWGDLSYTACGIYHADGFSSFGLDRKKILEKLGKDLIVETGGAGHSLFRKPDCVEVFDKAREIYAHYPEYAGNIGFSDEDVMSIVMTMMDLPPMPHGQFFSRYLSVQPGTLEMDARVGKCKGFAATTGESFEPCMMHFAANEAPVAYTIQLINLFRYFNVPTKGLLRMGLVDFYDRHVKLPLSIKKSRLKKMLDT